MDLKKLLLGDYHFHNESDDGKKSIDVKIKFGLIPNLLLLLVIIAIIWLIWFR